MGPARFRCLTTNEILDILNETITEDDADIYIEPLDVKELTEMKIQGMPAIPKL